MLSSRKFLKGWGREWKFCELGDFTWDSATLLIGVHRRALFLWKFSSLFYACFANCTYLISNCCFTLQHFEKSVKRVVVGRERRSHTLH